MPARSARRASWRSSSDRRSRRPRQERFHGERTPPDDLPEGTVSFLFVDIDGSTPLVRMLGDGYPAVLDAFREIVSASVPGERRRRRRLRRRRRVLRVLDSRRGCPGGGRVQRLARGAPMARGRALARADRRPHWPRATRARRLRRARGASGGADRRGRKRRADPRLLERGKRARPRSRRRVVVARPRLVRAQGPRSSRATRSNSSCPGSTDDLSAPACARRELGEASDASDRGSSAGEEEIDDIVSRSWNITRFGSSRSRGQAGSGRHGSAVAAAAQVSAALSGRGRSSSPLADTRSSSDQVIATIAEALGSSRLRARDRCSKRSQDAARGRPCAPRARQLRAGGRGAARSSRTCSEAALEPTSLVTSRIPLRLRGEHEFPVPSLRVPRARRRRHRCAAVRRRPAVRGSRARDATLLDARGPRGCRRSQRSADGWTGFRLRSSSRQRGCGCSGRSPCSTASETQARHGWWERSRPARAPAHADRDDRLEHELLTDDRACRASHVSRSSPVAGHSQAAEAVCGDDVVGDVLDTLERLAEHSLIVTGRGATGAARMRMLETIREYAAVRLEESGEAATFGAGMSRTSTTSFASCAPASQGSEPHEGMALLDDDWDNVRR